jgi:predicted MFS family arabinose efflux permease
MRRVLTPKERSVVLVIAAVQFVNVLDFVMVMPLGPDFAAALGIPTSQLGLVGGAYTAAAAVAGVAGSFFLDRFDRRPALGVAIFGLVCGTALGGFARGLGTLVLARACAGLFGGPATSLSVSIVADTVPAERRGAAMGITMAAFSAASVLGVPAGLELAQRFGWRSPFFSVAGLGVILDVCAILLLPPLRDHLRHRRRLVPLAHLFAQPAVRLSWLMTFVTMAAGFVIIPNLATYVELNLGYPRPTLGRLYFYAGIATFFSTQLGGRLVDRFGSFRVGTTATALLGLVLFGGFARTPPLFSAAVLVVAFMLALSLRNVSYNTLASKVPRSDERARFMSIQSAVQHAASAGGAFLSSRLLSETGRGALVGMGRVAAVCGGFTFALPFLLYAVESRVRAGHGGDLPGEPRGHLAGEATGNP